MARQGYAEFAGLPIHHGEMVHRRGASTPSYCVATIVPPEGELPELTGTLTLHFDGTTISFEDCAVDWSSLSESDDLYQVHILDRRWHWRNKTVGVDFNVLTDTGVRRNIKSARAIVSDLLDAIGESNYDLSGIPTNLYPEVTGRMTLPELLDMVCDAVSCDIVLTLNGTLKAVTIGQGGSSGFEQDDITQRLPIPATALPNTVRVVSGPTIFQKWFDLEAVGLDVLGQVTPVASLSYAGDWSNDSFFWWQTVGQDYRDYAFESVYRWYRIADTDANRLVFNDLEVTSIDQLRFRDVLAENWNGVTGTQRQPPRIRGTYWPLIDPAANTLAVVPDHWEMEFEPERRLVKFGVPVCRIESGGTLAPATLQGLFAFELWQDGVPWAQSAAVTASEDGVGERTYYRNEIRRRFVIGNYDEYVSPLTSDNLASVLGELDGYANQFSHRFRLPPLAPLELEGFRAVEPSGTVQEVRWLFGSDRIATTRVKPRGF